MMNAAARRLLIAIDGPAASGKGTVAKRLARVYELPHLDTGLLYRGVAAALSAAGAALEDEDAAEAAASALQLDRFEESYLRSAAMGKAASIVAGQPRVRAALLSFQRAFGARPAGAVIDGRDIASVVCPDADVKLFVTASLEERARRRARELEAGGAAVDLAALTADLAARDRRDRERATSPLVETPDAVLLDTTELSIDSAVAAATQAVRERTSRDPASPGEG